MTWPVTPYLGRAGATIDVSTGLTYPLKAERARRNPKIALGFSEPRGSGLQHPAAFVVQGLATVRDSDLRANSARYLAESSARLPKAFEAMPTPMLRRMAFYWSRIWVEMTPTRVLWWAGGDLDRAPYIWTAPAPVSAPPSDPAPDGRGAGSWSTAEPAPWQKRVRGALDRLGMPVLTTVADDGWPLPLRVRAADQTARGFRVRPPAGVDIADGPACLTFHTHDEHFESQDNISLVGHCRIANQQTAQSNSSSSGHSTTSSCPRTRCAGRCSMLSAGRRLRTRLESEAARRGQTVPTFDELGFRN